MKKAFRHIVLLLLSLHLCACDYWGSFDFEIVNETNDSLTIAYVEQMQSYTTILNTQGYEDEFMTIHLKDHLTDTIIPPHQSIDLEYDAGLVGRNFPTEHEDPRNYGIVPLWERIGFAILKGDTINPDVYSKERWKGKGASYQLTIRYTRTTDGKSVIQ